MSIAAVVFGLYMFLQHWFGLGFMGIGLGLLLLVPSVYYRIRPDPAAETLFVLVTKKDCSLCVEAREIVRAAIQGSAFTLEEVDVADHRFLRRYKNHIPVLFWQGDEMARLRVDPDVVKAKMADVLAARAARGASPSQQQS